MISVTISRQKDVRFVFASNCLWEGSCLIYVVCNYLHRVVSNTYCVVVCFGTVCPVLPISLDCPFLIAPSVFSNVY